ncbi:MAG: TonB-dependent receptor [Bacteroidaceae bacterium]
MLHNKTCSRKSVIFKQFNRKNYAAFCSLKKEVQIGVLGIATLAYANVDCVSAQTSHVRRNAAAIEEYQFTEAEVTGSRAPLAANQAARLVTTITRDEIARAAVQSVNDLLKLAVGVDVRQRGGFGVQTDISIGGGTFDQITLLLNGVSINNPQTGHLAADFPVSIQDIERIEILEGAAARVFGAQAFSGAINLVTSAKRKNEVGAHAEGGSYGSVGAGAFLNLATQDVVHHFSGEYQRSDGGMKNSDFSKWRGFYQGVYASPEVKVDWQAGASSQDYGANTFYSPAYPNQWEANSRYMASVKATTKVGAVRFTPMVSWIRSNDHFQLIRDANKGENFHRTDVYTVGLNGYSMWALGRTSFGAEIRGEGILSTNLGKPISEGQQVEIEGEKGRYYTKRDNRTNTSYYLEHNVLLDKWTLSAGVMMNRNTALDERYRFYPGVDISYRPSVDWTLFASWNKALRMPTFTDLYYKSPTQEGNVGLKPEETSAFRLGVRAETPCLKVSAVAFYQHGSNMIDWVMYHSSDLYHSTGFKLDNYGLELQGDLNVRALLGASALVGHIKAGYTYLYQKRHDDIEIYKSNYALEYLRHKFVASIDHRVVGKLSASWAVRWQQRMGQYLQYEGVKNTGVLVDYSPYALLDAKLQWTDKQYNLYLSFHNLTNHRYYDLGNIEQPGFWLMAGATIRFDL